MTITYLGFCFLFFICVFWPVRTFQALRKHPIGQPITTPKWKRYVVGLTFTLIQSGFAFWTAFDSRLPIFGSFRTLPVILATSVFLAITLGTLPWQVKHRSAGWRMRFYSILPETAGQRAAWVFICIIVAIGEEVIYRSVAWGLCYRLTGSYWVSAVIVSVVFALNHLVQGWISCGTILFIGFGFHVLVRITGGLYAAIAAHFLYDLLVGLIYGRQARKELGKTETAEEVACAAEMVQE